MADFQPETTVYLFESTGVDVENQPFFTSESAKIGWYMSHTTHTFNEYSYQREERGYIRVKEKAGNLRSCDMMAWKNSDWRWIIARVLSVEFINPNTTQIQFEVDSMQTFIDVIDFKACWIEREMETYDWNGSVPNLYNNTQIEGLETGLMIRKGVTPTDLYFPDLSMVVLSVYDEQGEPTVNGKINAGYPSGLNKISMEISDVDRLSAMLTTYANKGRLDGIAGIFITPSIIAVRDSLYSNIYPLSINFPTIDGYEVNNAKCFSAEFFSIELSNRRGNVSTFSLEELSDPANILLTVEGAFDGGTGGLILYPNTIGPTKDRGVILFNDIQVPYVGDGFKNWFSQNKYGIIADAASIFGGIVASAATGGIVGAAVGIGALSKGAQSIGRIADKATSPLSMGGQAANSGLPISIDTYGFQVNLVTPQYCNIQAIDEFFSKFGYKTNKLKKPNVNTRPLWNYVKTAGALVAGPFTYQDKMNIQNAMDNGVTFWHVPAATIGDYSNLAGNKG